MEAMNPQERFDSILEFLHLYDWVHSFTVTKFFVAEVWKSIPEEWCDVLLNLSTEELNRLPFLDGQRETKYPDSLRQFLHTAQSLCVDREPDMKLNIIDVDADIKRGMNPKKLHEVQRMSAVVIETAAKAGCDFIVDIGSGLGYLGQVVHRSSGCPVIGVEGCEGHTQRAEKRSAKQELQEDCIKNMTFNLQNSEQHLRQFEEKVTSLVNTIAPCQHFMSHRKSHDQLCGKTQTPHWSVKGQSPNLMSHDQSCDLSVTSDKVTDSQIVSKFGNSDLNISESCQEQKVKHHTDENVYSNERCEDHENVAMNDGNMEVHHGSRELHHGISVMHDGRRTKHDGNNALQYSSKVEHSASRPLQEADSQMHYGNNSKHHGKKEVQNDSAMNHGRSVCMIGLHCCGDLTPTMLHYFLQMECVRAFCLVSCCYHKMEYSDENDNFANFPLSQACKEAYRKTQSQHETWRLRPASLRLAAQETRSRWQTQTQLEHDNHTRHVAYRGLWELFCSGENTGLQTIDRKIIRKADFSNFDSFVESIIEKLDVADETKEYFSQRLHQLYSLHEDHLHYIEVVTALQVVLQPVLETLLQLDRLVYLQERRVPVQLTPVFHENISPRNLALVAIKDVT